MHPIERLRYLARSSGTDQRVLVGETASALRSLGMDPAGLVVSCRRIVERHPTSGPLYWLCSHLLTSVDPYSMARELASAIDEDLTPEVLIEALPIDATVCVVGWPDLAGEAVLRRGDLSVLAIDAHDQGASFVRRLDRADVVAEVVEPGGTAAAVLASSLVLVEAMAMGAGDLLAERGSRAAASVAYCSDVPVWAVAGVGRRLPDAAFTAMLTRVLDVRVAWDAEADAIPLALASHFVTADGVVPVEGVEVRPECPVAPELLRVR